MTRLSITSLVRVLAVSLLLLLVVSTAIAYVAKSQVSQQVQQYKLASEQALFLAELQTEVDEAQIGLVMLLDGSEAGFAEFEKHLKTIASRTEAAQDLFNPAGLPALHREETILLLADLSAQARQMLSALPEDATARETAIRTDLLPVLSKHSKSLAAEVDTSLAQARSFAARSQTTMAQGLYLQIGLAIAAVIVGIVVTFVVSRTLSKVISASVDAVQRLSKADYKTEITGTNRRDEVGKIARNLVSLRDRLGSAEQEREVEMQHVKQRQTLFDDLGQAMGELASGKMQHRMDAQRFNHLGADYVQLCENFNELSGALDNLVSAVGSSAKSVSENAQDLSSMSDDLSKRAETQAATLEETAAAIEELSVSVNQAAERAGKADNEVEEGRRRAEEGRVVMGRALEAMSSIARSSERINQIIAVIDDIAFQTNLLALNAGVEAARAGESGKGFSVVASEVRQLAQRASESAREIKELVVQSGKEVESGEVLVQETSRTLGQIVDNVESVSGLVAEIAASAKEQASGVQEINTGMTELDNVTQQNAAMVVEASGASTGLSRDAEKLTSHLDQFSGGQPIALMPDPPAPEPAQPKAPVTDWQPPQPVSNDPPPPPVEEEVHRPAKLASGSDLDLWEEF